MVEGRGTVGYEEERRLSIDWQCRGKTGWFPSNYVEEVAAAPAPMSVAPPPMNGGGGGGMGTVLEVSIGVEE